MKVPNRPSNFTCKTTMAVTGVLLAAFLLMHLFGNLKAFFDPQGFDDYARWLRVAFVPLFPEGLVLWLFRIVMGTAVVAHVYCAAVLWLRGRKARGKFGARHHGLRSFAARTMPITGIVIAGFIIFHLLDLTTGQTAAPGFVETTATSSAAYNNLVASLGRPAVGLFYTATMLLLGAHLAHGLWILVLDLGVTGRRGRAVVVALAGIIALIVMIGNAALPIAIMLGVLA